MFLPTSPRTVVSTFKTNFISKANNSVVSMLYTLIKTLQQANQNLCLAFLDIKISVEGNGLCASVYNKPTDSYSYVLYSSSYPSHVKNSFPFFLQFLRPRRLSSDDFDFSGKSEAKCHLFDKLGYPVSGVQAGHHRAQQIDRQSALQTA